MNAPTKHPLLRNRLIEEVLATATVSISDLKKNPAAVITEAQSRQVAILNRNRPVAYVIAPHVWEYLCDLVDDQRLIDEAREALDAFDRGETEVVEVDLADLV